jgi:trimethyllysine dioxygenase
MHDATKQRLLDTFSIPKDIAIESHAFEGPENETLRLEWSDGHISHYSVPLLAGTITRPRYKSIQRQGLTEPHLWDSSIASSAPQTTYDVVISRGTADLLRNLRTHGFCYVDETDATTPEATEKLLKQIAFIRETHYGGFYDFTADLASKDTAYTNIALEAHTDTTYFSDPAGLQAFHLLSHTEGSGGASLLVDGFNVAKKLLQTDRKAYKTLSTVNVHAHASGNEGISIQPYRGFPVENWYDAARKFNALLKKKKNEYWEQLTPGRVLIFDNWRVLHGRSAFTGKRRICGGYINRDDWISQYKMHTFGQDKVLSGLAVN